jgi:CBS domain-containing protein
MTPFLKSLTKRPCFTVSAISPISNVIEELSQNNIGAVVVTSEENAVQGIISERDIVRHLAKSKSINGLIASDIMTKDVVTVTPSVSSSELMQIMTENKFRHLPIISKGELVGVVSIGDVVKRMLEKYEAEAEQMRSFINA